MNKIPSICWEDWKGMAGWAMRGIWKSCVLRKNDILSRHQRMDPMSPLASLCLKERRGDEFVVGLEDMKSSRYRLNRILSGTNHLNRGRSIHLRRGVKLAHQLIIRRNPRFGIYERVAPHFIDLPIKIRTMILKNPWPFVFVNKRLEVFEVCEGALDNALRKGAEVLTQDCEVDFEGDKNGTGCLV